ncbi:MAG: type ISP restriction/modification enzyme, partial [Candidatus Binatia bacterium]
MILGNPPYSGHSANVPWKTQLVLKGKKTVKRRALTFIGKLIEDYKRVNGKPLGEKNPKWLQDDYVKFIRFAQWKINEAGEGVLGFITNHSYLDNPTFRGMRQSLMDSFDHIYLLDLHGNTLKKEKCPDGSEDKNVFDIRQGVAIGFFVKKKGLKKKVSHAERWGLREEKYNWLLENELNTTKWKLIYPKSDLYLFVPREEANEDRYNSYPKVSEIFPVSSVGIVTSRDPFVIDFEKEPLRRRVMMFRDPKMPDELIRQTFALEDTANWNLGQAREKVKQEEHWQKAVTKILYRPFDIQWIFYHDELVERSRKEVMRHMMQSNLGLC